MHKRMQELHFLKQKILQNMPEWTRLENTWDHMGTSPENKLNMDSPDRRNCYWHDLRKQPNTFFSKQQKCKSLVVWKQLVLMAPWPFSMEQNILQSIKRYT